MKYRILILLLFSIHGHLFAQRNWSRQETLLEALSKNPQIQLAALKIEKQTALKGAALNIASPEVLFEAPTSTVLRPGLLQNFDFPLTYVRNHNLQKQQVELARTEKDITLNELRYQVNTAYNELQYLREVYAAYVIQDSLLSDFAEVTAVRLEVGQISNLEKLNAESQYREVRYQLGQIDSRLLRARMQMNLLTGRAGDSVFTAADAFVKQPLPSSIIYAPELFSKNPLTLYYQRNRSLQHTQLRVRQSEWLPGLVVGYLNQGPDDTQVKYRMRYGFTVPLWFWSNRSRVKSARKDVSIAEQQQVLNAYTLQGNYTQALSELRQYDEAIRYYEQTALPQAEEISKTANEGYRLGSIGYYTYLLNLQQVIKIRLGYLDALRNYNQAVYTLQYLKGE